MARSDGIEAQELCVQALRSVRNCTDSDLFLTLTELEALTTQLEEETDLIGPDAAFQLLCISLEAIKTAKMAVAVSAFRVLKNGVRDSNIDSTLFTDDNMAVLSAVLDACVTTCSMFEDMMAASALDLLAKIFLRMLQVNPSRFLVLLGESVQGLASTMLKISFLCLGRCFGSAAGNGNTRVLLMHQQKYQSPAVVSAMVLLAILDHTADSTLALICHLDAELEELVLCMTAYPPYAVLEVYGKILHTAVQAASQMRKGAMCNTGGLAQQDFDFFRRAKSFCGLTEFLLEGMLFDVFGFLKWRAGCNLQPKHDMTTSFQVDFMTEEQAELPRVLCDGLELRIQDPTSSKTTAQCIPLSGLISGKVIGSRVALNTLSLPADGQDPRLLAESKDWQTLEKETSIEFRSEKDAHRGMSWILERVNIEAMCPFDDDFLECVFDDTRMPLGYQGAQQLQKPSIALWPHLVGNSSGTSNHTSKEASRKIFYASTKGCRNALEDKSVEDNIEREHCFDKRLESVGGISQLSAPSEFLRKEARANEIMPGLQMSFPLSGDFPTVRYRRVGIATTKKTNESSQATGVSTSPGAQTQQKQTTAADQNDISQMCERTRSPEGDEDREKAAQGKPIQMSAQHVDYMRSISISQPGSQRTPGLLCRAELAPRGRTCASASQHMRSAAITTGSSSIQDTENPLSYTEQHFPSSIVVSQTTSVIPLVLGETLPASNSPLLQTARNHEEIPEHSSKEKANTDVFTKNGSVALKRKRNGLLEKDGLPIFKSGFVPQVDSIDFPVVDLLNMAIKKVQKEKHECLSAARSRVKTIQGTVLRKLRSLLQVQERERRELFASFEAEKRKTLSKLHSLERTVESIKVTDCAAAIPECKLVELADSESNRSVMELLKSAKQSIRANLESLNKDSILRKA